MIFDHVTIIVEPDNFHLDKKDRNKEIFPSPVEYLRLVDFKKQLSEVMRLEVRLIIDYLSAAPMNGLIILCPRRRGYDFEENIKECSRNLRDSLPQRLLLINVLRGTIFDLLEQYKLIGAVQDFEIDYWWDLKSQVIPKQEMHGLTKVAIEMKANIQSKRENYCQFEGDKYENLPRLLTRYLKTYVNIFYQPNPSETL